MADPIDLTFRARDAEEALAIVKAVEAVRRARPGRRPRAKATITDLDRQRAARAEERLRAAQVR